MKKILLSYTTLDDYTRWSHTYINKLMGIKKEENEFMTKGKEAHKKLQDHMIGKTKLPIDLKWDITQAEYHARKDVDEKYQWHGYLDGVNFRSKLAVEIKTGSPWSNRKFEEHIQPRYYSWVTGLRKFVFVTCHFDLSELKVYYKEMTNDDWKQAEGWAYAALKGIKDAEFKGGLDDDGYCIGCSYGFACYFAR